MTSKGTVYLVGAGPGDAGLLTLRGAELLARADVVIHDALVNLDLLRLAPKSVEVIYAGKRCKEHAISQEELNRLLITRARDGKCVVRLKGGDPYIFGRGGEEAEELAAAGIPFEVVPGVSSITAGPNYAGIPLTHREHSSCFTVITGHEDPSKTGGGLDFEQLARLPGTKVVLMGVKRISQIAESLVAHGMDPATPVGMVRWATTGRQQYLEGTLGTIATIVAASKFSPPAVTVIGDVVKLHSKLNWFERRPLFGKRIVVTRLREHAGQLVRQLLDLGADVIEVPTIKVVPPEEKQPVVEALQGIREYDWIVFTSPNGVATFFDYFFKAFDDVRAIGNIRFAAVGAATAARLKDFHLRVDVMPEESLASKIAGAISKFESVENLRILLARAQVANSELPRTLEEMGAIVDDIAFYRTVAETDDPAGAGARILEGGADWIMFTSGSTVRNFHTRFDLPKLATGFPQIKLASIGPETSKAIAELGLKPTVEAKHHNIEGLVKALQAAAKKS